MSNGAGGQHAITKIWNAKLSNEPGWSHIEIVDGTIASLTTSNTLADAPEAPGQLNAAGRVVLPGLIDAHTHIDKNFSPVANTAGTLAGAIEAMAEYKQQRTLVEVSAKAEQALQQAISHGVCLLRSHFDLGSFSDLDILAALVDLKERYQNRIDLHITAMGPTETRDNIILMREALALGADYIGGVPALTGNPFQAINHAVELALELDKGLDLHIDEKEGTEFLTLEMLADLCLACNFQLPVVASHCVSLAFLPEAARDALIEKVVAANIAIIGLPVCNLNLMSRQLWPAARGITPIKRLQQLGATVCVASDNVQDPFNPFGNYDPLLASHIACIAGQLTATEELHNAVDLVTNNPAKAFALANYGIAPGNPASLVITNAESYEHCNRTLPARLATVFKGNLVYQKEIIEHWF
ncbi:amidohydrolase family protein [Halioxenophilus sp. WMMB6]|uniref:amidohydrolase family protein n=1 Tax=Halioxenophilus sp. WMMB6 TaxID=3073815 RepID=UPI00295E5CC7|nr:amidohydrolase family protein [Halioxenophilus sp. WMMB6]